MLSGSSTAAPAEPPAPACLCPPTWDGLKAPRGVGADAHTAARQPVRCRRRLMCSPAPGCPLQSDLLDACGMVPGATKIPCYRLFLDGEEVEVRGRGGGLLAEGSRARFRGEQGWEGGNGRRRLRLGWLVWYRHCAAQARAPAARSSRHAEPLAWARACRSTPAACPARWRA